MDTSVSDGALLVIGLLFVIAVHMFVRTCCVDDLSYCNWRYFSSLKSQTILKSNGAISVDGSHIPDAVELRLSALDASGNELNVFAIGLDPHITLSVAVDGDVEKISILRGDIHVNACQNVGAIRVDCGKVSIESCQRVDSAVVRIGTISAARGVVKDTRVKVAGVGKNKRSRSRTSQEST